MKKQTRRTAARKAAKTRMRTQSHAARSSGHGGTAGCQPVWWLERHGLYPAAAKADDLRRHRLPSPRGEQDMIAERCLGQPFDLGDLAGTAGHLAGNA